MEYLTSNRSESIIHQKQQRLYSYRVCTSVIHKHAEAARAALASWGEEVRRDIARESAQQNAEQDIVAEMSQYFVAAMEAHRTLLRVLPDHVASNIVLVFFSFCLTPLSSDGSNATTSRAGNV